MLRCRTRRTGIIPRVAEVLREPEKNVPWLANWTIHNAGRLRENADS